MNVKNDINVQPELTNAFDDLCDYVKKQKIIGKKIALCHGCFDPLHLGHVMHFDIASHIADIVVVTVTPDLYVYKGENRPCFNQHQRKYLIDSIKYVDKCAINLWETAVETIKCLSPNYLVKGSDYKNSLHSGFLLEKKAIEEIKLVPMSRTFEKKLNIKPLN